MRAAVPLLAALSLPALGCAHSVQMVSEPPGAEVVVDGELVCKTPCVLEETSGSTDVTRVEMRHGGEAVRFDLLAEGWTFEPVVVGIVLAAGSLALSGAALAIAGTTYGATTAFLITGASLIVPSPGAASLGLLLIVTGFSTAMVAYTLGLSLATLGPRIPLAMAGEASRISDDEVFVDFEENEVYSSPGDHVQRLVGASEGFVPMPAAGRSAEDAGPEGEDEDSGGGPHE